MVTGFICHVGWEVSSDIAHRILDGVDPAVIATAESAAAETAGVIHAHARARWTGRTLRVEVEGWLDPDTSVADADRIGRRVADRVSNQLPEVRSFTLGRQERVTRHCNAPGPGQARRHKAGVMALDSAAPAAPGWDHLLVDQDDPEKRIAELERQLAAQKRGADLPPASPHQAAASHRFVAFPAPPTSMQIYKFIYGSLAAYIALMFVFGIASMALGPSMGSVAYTLPTVFAFGILVIGGVVLFQRFPRFFGREDRRKQILLCVTSDGLTVDRRPGDVFSFADAKLGLWIPARIVNLTMGAALHLQSGTHAFVLGGRDHRIANGTRLDAPPAGSVDAWMWASDFAGLLAMVGRRSGLEVRGRAPGEPTRCLLFPNVSRLFSYSGFGMFNNAQTLRTLRASPAQPGLAMDVGKDAIWVTDLNINALIASAWLAQVTATPAENKTYVYQAGTWTTPVLVVRVPGLQPLTIGCPDSPDPAWPRVSYSAIGARRNVSRFSWRGEVYQENQPDYVVSGADWLTLVEKFGLAPQLEDTANRVGG